MTHTEGLPLDCMDSNYTSHTEMLKIIGIVAFVLAAVSLGLGLYWQHKEAGLPQEQRRSYLRVQKSLILAAWILLPPLWFFCEYMFWYSQYGKAVCFEGFKYMQDLGSKGWAGMVIVLGVLFFKGDILNKD
jgi:hypothetical protein